MKKEPSSAATLRRAYSEHGITVLLVDDQAIIGEAVRRMLAGEPDIVYHYCSDPAKALSTAASVAPTVVLLDLVMPDIDGLTLAKFFRANPATRDVPLIVLSTKEEATTKAEAFAVGANDYLVKLPDKIELIARIRYHSRGFISLLQRNEAHEALVASQRALAKELHQAAEYVKSLLPPPMDGPIKAEWEFIPCSSLGGDSFGYHWLDNDHFAVYLLDVCGHGVGAALLSISVINVLRSHSLPETRFQEPSEVLEALNEAFPMEKQNDTYFTMWYGVYDKKTRRLLYSSGGHPPAILLTGDEPGSLRPVELKNSGFVVGGMPGVEYETASVELGAVNRLHVFSDGAYEIARPDGTYWTYQDFLNLVAQPSVPGTSDVRRILEACRAIAGSETFDDDFCLLQVTLP
jgi:sigma-B regulation protein RsbU (phosphoserine phosphatase)